MEENNNTNDKYKFQEFVTNCVAGNGSLLTSDNELFTEGNLVTVKDFLKAIKPLFDTKNKEAKENNKDRKAGKQKTWGIGDIFNGSVFESDLSKFKNNEEAIIKILLHCNWLMYLCSDRQHKQKPIEEYYKEDKDIDEYFNVKTEWAIGPTFSGTSLDAMLFIVELVLKVKDKKDGKDTVEGVVSKIEELCNNKDKWKDGLKWNDKKPISSDAIVNILLFLCNSERYLPIPAQNKKELICKKLKDLLSSKTTDDENKTDFPKGMSETDQKLYVIRKIIRGIYNNLKNEKNEKDEQKKKEYEKIKNMLNPFWLPNIRPFWDESTENLKKENLSDETLLEYKKAMILYGPPGTSKSYQARRRAESMIAKALRKTNNTNIACCINNLQKTLDSHIHILQMHPNYTYDDFIIGKSIENNKIVVKPGKMLQIIAGIKEDDNLPHFVILDEINRVDISRVFGELFTAMESSYREKGVELSVDVSQIPEGARQGLTIDNSKLFLKVPENMYFIGTMNMIDFSLEQVDFALRRRFLWKLSTYDPERLEEIISEKVKEKIINLQEEKEIGQWKDLPENFTKCCTALNNEIEWENNLGKNYLIGHAFFAEIVDIFERVNNWGKAKNILWQVSILPTLDAYCGTMDAEMRERFIEGCKNAFLPELKENTQQSQPSEITNEQ